MKAILPKQQCCPIAQPDLDDWKENNGTVQHSQNNGLQSQMLCSSLFQVQNGQNSTWSELSVGSGVSTTGLFIIMP